MRELKVINATKNHKTKRVIEIQDSIRKVLFNKWEPIGVNDNSNLIAEYNVYIAPIYRILVESRSEDEIINSLSSAERDIVGESCSSSEELRTITKELLTLNIKTVKIKVTTEKEKLGANK